MSGRNLWQDEADHDGHRQSSRKEPRSAPLHQSRKPSGIAFRGGSPLELEGGFSPDVERLLRERGHTVRPSMTMGSTQSIMIEGDRFLGAADTRRPDALALGVQ